MQGIVPLLAIAVEVMDHWVNLSGGEILSGWQEALNLCAPPFSPIPAL